MYAIFALLYLYLYHYKYDIYTVQSRHIVGINVKKVCILSCLCMDMLTGCVLGAHMEYAIRLLGYKVRNLLMERLCRTLNNFVRNNSPF